MQKFMSLIPMAIIKRPCKDMSWVSGRWFLGEILWLVEVVIGMSGFGICLLGKTFESTLRILLTSIRESKHTLRGHTSTVRCLKMSDANTAISGSRDTTLRIWDIKTGLCKNVLVGHIASVRCLEIHGDIVVSGSYDTTAKVWSISEGRCLRTLNGHFSQIYAIAFDGKRIATGSLDTSVRIWDPENG
jgi:WD40 repeat protein